MFSCSGMESRPQLSLEWLTYSSFTAKIENLTVVTNLRIAIYALTRLNTENLKEVTIMRIRHKTELNDELTVGIKVEINGTNEFA